MEAAESATSQKQTYVIRPVTGWLDLHPGELWRYRDLIMLFVRRDFVSVYKQTILGPLWFLLQPLFSTIVFTIIFGKVARIPTDGLPQPLFYLSGLVVWNYFSSCLTRTSDTFAGNAGIFGKVFFPRLAVPISVVISTLTSFGMQFVLFLGFYAYFYLKGAAIVPRVSLFYLPLLIVQMAALGLGFGIIISSLTTKYRDLTFLTGFGMQLWMYATPIVYPTSLIPEKWRWLLNLNPMASVVDSFRYAFLGVGSFHPWQAAFSAAGTFLVLLIGVVLFSRVEKSFMDTV